VGIHGSGWGSFIRYDDKQDHPAVTRALLARVWKYSQPYSQAIALLLFSILLTSGIGLISPLLYRDLIDNALPNRDLQRLNWLAAGMVAIPLVSGLIGVWQRRLNSAIGEGVIYDLRRALYGHLQRMSLRFFTRTRTGELMSRLNNDVIGAQRAISSTLVEMVSNVVSVLATLSIMFALEWRLTLLGLLILPLFLLPARRIARRLRVLSRRSMEYNAEMNATMNETLNISGALLVKLFGRERSELMRFGKDAERVRSIGIQSAVTMRWLFMLLGTISAVGSALVFWVGGHLVLRDAFTIGTIVAFGSYIGQLYGPLVSLTNAQVEFARSLVSFERVFEVLDIPVEIRDAAKARVLSTVEGRIVFEGVSFAYQRPEEEHIGLEEIARLDWRGSGDAHLKRGRQAQPEAAAEDFQGAAVEESLPRTGIEGDAGDEVRWALQDVSFSIKPGQLAALVGASGAGKTTITYLIPRLYDPGEGRIRIDGLDLKEISLQSLADNIGMVTQETYLFYDTILANLKYARPDASDEDIVASAQAANIHEFIAGLPDGYDTVVGERGYRLSGGERQRIALARVFLKDPQILVLDEATSHLDSVSEALIQNSLQQIFRGRTSLVIAHRLSTILAADKILVLEDGRIAEQGTHAELLQAEGLYTKLYETQFKPMANPAAPDQARR